MLFLDSWPKTGPDLLRSKLNIFSDQVIQLFYNECIDMPFTCNSHLIATMETGQV